MRLEEISEKAPRAGINGLVYLKDVDTAKELLVGKTVYIQAESVRIDDANNYSGISGKNRIQRYAGTFLLSGSCPLTNKLRHGPE